MTTHIQKSLTAGIIHPYSSPAGASFFFVEKKDKSLHPCNNYRGRNDITVLNSYPLPLMNIKVTFCPCSIVCSITICKAEKSKFHVTSTIFLGFTLLAGNIQMDPARIKMVRYWPCPETWKQLQTFLGFSNF
ncbi:hypothetical protein QTP70_018659 [Hemibagrus guttatus]|uniref:Uncharacterized protein n=1 Tax=Hemibagrus guttatus TaxID=175788 RepID=A0AAE0Q6W7_9TELE|nr:hypothetical protein QTP70_018659 [Hemibagrus guttatus]